MADTRKNETTRANKPLVAKNKKAKVTVKPKAKPKTRPKVKLSSAKVKSKTSTNVKAPAKTKFTKKQSAKGLLSNQEKDVPDLNTSTGYPVHPNRIWPD